jgi:O-antigen ligase
VILVLIALALLEALYGLAEQLSGHHYILWLPSSEQSASGTFINRNHFAATLSLFLPITVGWFYFRAAGAHAALEAGRLLPPASWDVLSTRHGLWMLAPPLLAAGTVQSHSRGGFCSMLFGLGLMFALGVRNRAARALSLLGIVLGLTMFAYGINSDYGVVLDRFTDLIGQQEGETSRTAIWRNSVAMFRDYPVWGVGLGGFPTVYRRYAQADTAHYPYWAHNEWWEGLLSLGLVGMSLIVALVAAVFVQSLVILRRTGRDQPWLLGVWCGLSGLALHSFAEFNFHIPSIAMSACLLAGILLGYGRHRRRERPNP